MSPRKRACAGRYAATLRAATLCAATLCVTALLACATDRLDHGSSQSATSDGGTLRGSVSGDAGHVPPTEARIIVVWRGGLDGLERLYKLGEGTATATTFNLTLQTPPPAEAMVNGETGIGFVYLLPITAQLADGLVAEEWLERNAIGATPDHLIVYRGPLGPAYSWLTTFPLGFSCASRDAGELHAHTRADCEALQLTVGDIDTFSFVTWP